MSDALLVWAVDDAAHLALSYRDAPDLLVLRLAGEVDLAVAAVVRRFFVDMLLLHDVTGKVVVLDFRDLEVIDSGALGIFVGFLKRVRANGGRVVLAHPSARIWRIFVIVGLDKVFAVESWRAP